MLNSIGRRRFGRIRRALGVLTSAALLSCASPVEPPALLVHCSGQLAITVGKSLPQTFEWLPRCGATYLEVTSADGQAVYWIVQADTGRFPSPVRLGITPRGMRTVFGPEPFSSGGSYLVRVGLLVDENSFVVIGEQAFSY